MGASPQAPEHTAARRPRLGTFSKYVLLELPGWLFAALVLAALARADYLSPRVALLLLALWVAKDFALYPALRIAYQDASPDATVNLIGAHGTVRDRLAPSGWVRVGSELWRAELAPDADPVESGGGVRVRAVRGFTLLVEPATEPDAGP